MGRSPRVTVGVAAAVALVALAAACRRSPVTNDDQAPAGASASASAAMPVDHLGPDELLEGGEKAFGVALPRVLVATFPNAGEIIATGPVGVHPLVKYFQARLQDGSLREGKDAATFENVKVPGKPDMLLRIRIEAMPMGSRVEVQNTTPPPTTSLPDEPSRWRQVGLTPSGKIADPSHLD